MAESGSVASGTRTDWSLIRTLDVRDWRDLVEASATLVIAHLALKAGSPARVIARATRVSRVRPAGFTIAREQRVLWLAGVAGRHVVPVPCLSRAVALARVLARRGVRSAVRLGVRTVNDTLDAHAWVEVDGRPVNDDAAHVSGYAPLERSARGAADVRPAASMDVAGVLAAILRGDDVSAEMWRVAGVEAFCEAAEQHGVLPLVAEQLRQRSPAPPADLATTVRDAARAHAARDVLAEVELRAVVAALDAAGLDPVVFKGAHLAYVDYPRPDLRPRLDTDVLIPAHGEARRIAHDVLITLGYESPPHAGGDLVMTQRSYVKRRGARVEHAVDVHWRIANPQVFARVLTHDEVGKTAMPVPRIGPGARGPAGAHALLIACVHRVAHHADAAWLIWLVDIDRLARRLTDHEWTQFLGLVRERQVVAVCGRSLARAIGVFGTPVPGRVLQVVGEQASCGGEATKVFLDPPPGAMQAAVRDLRALGSLPERARFAREYLAPPADYMRQVYAPGSGAPLAWLYLRRIVGGAISRGRQRRARAGDAGS